MDVYDYLLNQKNQLDFPTFNTNIEIHMITQSVLKIYTQEKKQREAYYILQTIAQLNYYTY